MASQFNGDLGYDGFSVTLNYFTGLPDPSGLSDANLVILFKSLLKKDSITKEKALNDLMEAFDSEQTAFALKDDLTIISWVQVYPKLAIDNSRSVRTLSHQTQAKFLQLIGGKSFSKYLKSSIPVWLYGLFDNDRTVAAATFKSLLSSFQNEREKIDKLWKLFYEQVIGFVVTGIALETAESLSDKRYTKEEDSIGKYERVVAGCLNMLNKVIQIEPQNDELTAEIEALLLKDNIWDLLATALNVDNLNFALVRSIFTLIRGLLEKPNLIVKFSDPKGLLKLIVKKFIKNVKLKSQPGANGNMIYSSIVLPLWETLNVIRELTLSDTAKDIKIKKPFMELGGSKSFSRILEYLKLGACNSGAEFYPLVSRFFDQAFLAKSDYKEYGAEEIELVIKVLIKQFQSTLGISNKTRCFKCLESIFNFHQDQFSESELEALHQLILHSAVDTLTKTRPMASQVGEQNALIQIIAHFMESTEAKFGGCFSEWENSVLEQIESGTSDYSREYYEKYFDILSHFKTKPLKKLSDQIIDHLLDNEPVEDLQLAFDITSVSLQGDLCNSEKIEQLIEMLPAFIEENFVQPPTTLFYDYMKFGRVPSNETVNDFFFKLSIVSQTTIPRFLLEVKKHVKFNKSSHADIHNYIINLSERSSLTADQSELVYSNIDDSQIFTNVLNSCLNSGNAEKFITTYSSLENKATLSHLGEHNAFQVVVQQGWKTIERDEVQKFFGCIDSTILEEGLFEYVNNASFSTDFKPIAEYLQQTQLKTDKFLSLVEKSLNELDMKSLAVSNPLQQNIALSGTEKNNAVVNESLLVIGKFVLELLKINQKMPVVILGLFISEYTNDYLFLNSQSGRKFDDEALQLRSDILGSVNSIFEGITLEKVATSKSDNNVIEWLLEDMRSNKISSFYSARVFKLFVERVFENLSFKAFEESDVNFSSIINSNPLQLSVLLQSGSKFFNTKTTKFDRLRNFVAAEILGVRKTEQILTDGIKWVSLLINFFNSEQPYEVIPPHRLAMIINQVSGWLDSDIAYEEEFINLRVQLVQLFGSLISNSTTLSEKFWEVALKLIVENLSICGSEVKRLDLRYFTLKLILLMIKEDLEDITDIKEELLDLLLNKEIIERDVILNNMPVDLIYSLTQRVFAHLNLTTKIANPRLNDLYETLSDSHWIPLQRIVVPILKDLIVVNQQDFVVEYQFMKSKLSKDDDEASLATLPETLLNSSSKLNDDIDSGNPEVFEALWSWLLIFTHFEDITLSMKKEYIRQLKDKGLSHLFSYIFEQVDVSGNKLMPKIDVASALQTYDIRKSTGETLEDELRELLLHLYFNSLRYLGSEVQAWFKEIRDRQLKQTIEKFTSTSVSSILIIKILDEVTGAKSSIEAKDENLTIKVNKVTNEIKSVYIIDEYTMEMVIKIPNIYPLENVSVSGPLRLGVKENQWKAWLLASQKVISLTNGSIVEAIELFNRNVNLHFSGFEECAICYSILHQDLSLPSKTCTTCNNKFHAACLYKWFKSSGSSTCPLCRSPFNFKK